ncbi:hypothetical protein [Mycobacterium sp. 852013-50091_SCH5140682]|uniref:hypothetical protein n=1 Tax=Mycobacterium sp. 852013-50091_SCH5140682 TaxID=1834109 RepID=UPI001E4B25FE|nr:hypothetical protein [Mycobacterium sp. 852013-50091_SCH5140682]
MDDLLANENIDSYLAFRLRVVRDLLPGLQRSAQAMPYVDALDQAEADELLGFAPRDWIQTDQDLEDFVSHHGATCEAEVARLLARRVRRQIDLITPGMRDVRGFRVQPINWAAIPST